MVRSLLSGSVTNCPMASLMICVHRTMMTGVPKQWMVTRGLNGDIIVWNEILECAVELTSMGIRVDKTELMTQLELTNETGRC